MNELKAILLISAGAWLFVQVIGEPLKYWLCRRRIWYKLDTFLVAHPRRIKPLDCPMCMGFWGGMAYGINTSYDFHSYCAALAWAVACSFVAIIIERVMNRL